MKVFGKLRQRFQEKRAVRRDRWKEKKVVARRGDPGPHGKHPTGSFPPGPSGGI
jgi:hypothetical protein